MGGIDFVFRGPVVEVGVFGVEEVLLEMFRCVAFRVELAPFLDSGIVDQDAEAFLSAFYFFGEALDVGFVGHVGGDGDDLTGDAFSVRLYHGVELVLTATNDIDFGAIDCQGLGAH